MRFLKVTCLNSLLQKNCSPLSIFWIVILKTIIMWSKRMGLLLLVEVFLEEDGMEAGLSWGMVDVNQHKAGIGKMLTEYRIDLLKEFYPGKIYKVDTSQHTAGFYLKRGFETIEVIADGFAKGIDKYVMKMGPIT